MHTATAEPSENVVSDLWSDPHCKELREVAAALGVCIEEENLGIGSRAEAHLLEDGRVLKMTTSDYDAAACFTILRASNSADLPTGIVRIHDVRRLQLAAGETYAIIMDRAHPFRAKYMDEALVDELERYNQHLWDAADPLDSYIPQSGNLSAADDGIVTALISTVTWLRQELGIFVRDLCVENIASTQQGGVGTFDFSHARVPVSDLLHVRQHKDRLLLRLAPEPILDAKRKPGL